MSSRLPKIIISGGGTGGHIYPAIAIADELKNKFPNAEFLFVGAMGKMEMEKVPKAGYSIIALPIKGIERGSFAKNLLFPYYLIKSLWMAKKIIQSFQPDLAIGTGGYASAPTLWVASMLGIPCLIQEQNAFPGITNKVLARKVQKICVAFEGMEKYFPKEKIEVIGNPIRQEMFSNKIERDLAVKYFGLDPNKPIVLSIGGSQGARAINQAWQQNLQILLDEGIQLIWQVGKLDFAKITSDESINKHASVVVKEFIYDMDMAYAAADLVVSRAGAIAISELAAMNKPCVLVPLPTAAENHQEKNALQLVEKYAAVMIKNSDLKNELVVEVCKLAKDEEKLERLSKNISAFAKPNAAKEIAEIASKLIKA